MVLLFKGDVSGDTPLSNSEPEDDLTEALVTWIGNDQEHTVYLMPAALVEPYTKANGIVLGLNEKNEDTELGIGRLVEHFALMTGQEPCFLQCVPSLAEYLKLQEEGPGVPDHGSKFCVAPWRKWLIPTEEALSKGMLKNVERILVMGWVL